MLSRRARYALRALTYLAARPGERGAPTPEIAVGIGAPAPFLAGIFLDLRQRGLVVSRRGRRGGYVLARPPAAISYADVLKALDGSLAVAPCAAAGCDAVCPECVQSAEPCPLKGVLRGARDALLDVLQSVSLADGVALERGRPLTPAQERLQSILTT